MARKQFTTTIDEDIQSNFKEACSKNDIPMNDVLETFMQDFINGKFHLEKEVQFSLKPK